MDPSEAGSSDPTPSPAIPANLEACLPADLRGRELKISRIATGLSGAGVYRVDAAGQSFVLKISAGAEPLGEWRQQLRAQQLAAKAGLTPGLVHVDEAHRVIVTMFVNDRSFPTFYRDPHTHESALGQLGRLLRRVHALPWPTDLRKVDARGVLATLWPDLAASFTLPSFVSEAVTRFLAEVEPSREGPMVLSHNDVNPSNVIYDGKQLFLLDWAVAGANDAWYDLATTAVFLRMDDATSAKLIAAHDGAPTGELSPRFKYLRRLAALFCGVNFLKLARESGHTGARGGETVEATLSLLEFYQQLRTGTLSPATPEGKWSFGLALVKSGVAL